MLLGLIMALMTGAAVMAVLWPLSRSVRAAASAGETDLDFYRHQLGEIAREERRGLISGPDAEAARSEAGRRLLRSASGRPMPDSAMGEPALRRRRAASALGLSIVPLVGLALYGALGTPRLSSPTTRDEIAETGPPAAFGAALAEVERRLASHPEDVRGWDLVAPLYLRLGRFEDAEKAFAAARRYGGDTPERLAGHGEAMVSAAGGVVSAEAGDAFAKALALDAGLVKARFYLALAAEQDGRAGAARTEYERLIAAGPADAAWLPLVQARLARLNGAPAQPVASLARDAVTPEIKGMVEGLDARLAAQGGSEPEWSRLVRSYAVLGERDLALDRLARARQALAGEAGAQARLDALAGELGLPSRREAAR